MLVVVVVVGINGLGQPGMGREGNGKSSAVVDDVGWPDFCDGRPSFPLNSEGSRFRYFLAVFCCYCVIYRQLIRKRVCDDQGLDLIVSECGD